MKNRYPLFIGIGGHRCASTWLFQNLKDINGLVSTSKETHFFSRHFDHGFNWYYNEINKENSKKLFCEFSTSYLYDYFTPKRIKKYFPKTKIIIILRNPIYRFYSHYKHETHIGHNKSFDLKKSFFKNPSYLELGNYFPYLKRWLSFYDKNEICIVLLDDIINDTLTTFNKIQKFLGFSSLNDLSKLSNSINFSLIPKNNHKLDYYFFIKNFLKNHQVLRNMIPAKIKKIFKEKIERQLLNKKDFLSIEDYNFIKAKYSNKEMKENFEKLSLFLKKDLKSLWFKKKHD